MLLCDSVKMSKSIDINFKLYGKNLRERHDDLADKYKLVKNSSLNRSLSQIQKEVSVKQYGDRYIAVIPGSVHDFQVEAENQRHCVLSYTENMAHGESLIIFIRYKDATAKSHITLELRNRKIVQARRFANQAIGEEDREYLKGLSKVNSWYFYF